MTGEEKALLPMVYSNCSFILAHYTDILCTVRMLQTFILYKDRIKQNKLTVKFIETVRKLTTKEQHLNRKQPQSKYIHLFFMFY